MQRHDQVEVGRNISLGPRLHAALDVLLHAQMVGDNPLTAGKIPVVEQPVLAEAHPLVEAERQAFYQVTAIEFVGIGVDQLLPCPNVFVREIGDRFIHPILQRPGFPLPIQVDTLNPEDVQIRSLRKQGAAFFQKIRLYAIVRIQKRQILAGSQTEPLVFCGGWAPVGDGSSQKV